MKYYKKENSIIASDLDLDLEAATEADWNKQNESTYIDERKEAYPSVEEQLDMIYWDKVNGTNLWQEKITQIKAKYQKK